MLPVLRSARANQDLLDIWTHVAEHDADAADALLDAMGRRCDRLSRHPELGPARSDIRPGMRTLVVGRYVVLYKIDPDAVRIVRCLHGSRDLQGLFTA